MTMAPALRLLWCAAFALGMASALAWLAAQPQVDRQRGGVLGWSNGATTTLTLLEQRRAHPEGREGVQSFLQKRKPNWL